MTINYASQYSYSQYGPFQVNVLPQKKYLNFASSEIFDRQKPRAHVQDVKFSGRMAVTICGFSLAAALAGFGGGVYSFLAMGEQDNANRTVNGFKDNLGKMRLLSTPEQIDAWVKELCRRTDSTPDLQMCKTLESLGISQVKFDTLREQAAQVFTEDEYEQFVNDVIQASSTLKENQNVANLVRQHAHDYADEVRDSEKHKGNTAWGTISVKWFAVFLSGVVGALVLGSRDPEIREIWLRFTSPNKFQPENDDT